MADLGADEFDVLTIVNRLRDKLSIVIQEEDIETIVTVQDIYNYVDKNHKL